MAKVVHTCSGCVPIDVSIIGVYTSLVKANSLARQAAEAAEQAAEYAIGKAPYIGENGNWWEWDTTRNEFVDTSVQARTSVAVDDHLSESSTNPVQNSVVTEALGQKQATLISGTNIKTIGGVSILGQGDIDLAYNDAVCFLGEVVETLQ